MTNAEFARTLGHVLKRPAFVPLPSFAPKLVLGSELVDTLLLESKRVMPRVLEADGYSFHPSRTLECRADRLAVLDRSIGCTHNFCGHALLRLDRVS